MTPYQTILKKSCYTGTFESVSISLKRINETMKPNPVSLFHQSFSWEWNEGGNRLNYYYSAFNIFQKIVFSHDSEKVYLLIFVTNQSRPVVIIIYAPKD